MSDVIIQKMSSSLTIYLMKLFYSYIYIYVYMCIYSEFHVNIDLHLYILFVYVDMSMVHCGSHFILISRYLWYVKRKQVKQEGSKKTVFLSGVD